MELPGFRDAVGTFPTGVTVVTTHDAGEDFGLTVSAFCSLSLDPAMVMVAVASTSRTLAHLGVGAPIGVSVLSEGQLEVAQRFARSGGAKFEGVLVHRATDGVPLIDGASAWFYGQVAGVYLGGDHTILAINVQDLGHEDDARPMLYQRGSIFNWPL